MDRPHAKLAEDTWRLIQALLGDDLTADTDAEYPDRDAAMQSVIEIACDAAVESALIRLGTRPRGV